MSILSTKAGSNEVLLRQVSLHSNNYLPYCIVCQHPFHSCNCQKIINQHLFCPSMMGINNIHVHLKKNYAIICAQTNCSFCK